MSQQTVCEKTSGVISSNLKKFLKMVFRRLLTKAAPIARGIATTSVSRSGHGEARSLVGSNLPFSINNRYRLMVTFILYFASGIGLPFWSIRYMTLAKSSG